MDGFEATKQIMAHTPTPILVVSSSASGREVQFSMDAIKAGALMVVSKPDNPMAASVRGSARRVARHGEGHGRSQSRSPLAQTAPVERTCCAGASSHTGRAASAGDHRGVDRRARPRCSGSSRPCPTDFPLPILVVQHIAAGFAAGFADWLHATCQVPVKLAEQGEPLRRGTVYLAPDGRQLGVTADARVALTEDRPVGGFRPSGTYLFESAARVYGASLVAVILTGMGSDGVEGLKAVKAAGGRVLAQDEASSIVYGMPREAVVGGRHRLRRWGWMISPKCLMQLTYGRQS